MRGVKEEGEILYHVPEEALKTLDAKNIPYDLLETNVAAPSGLIGVR